MNLMDAVFAVFSADANEPLFNRVYHIDQDIVYLVYSPKQSELSKIGWTKMAKGYIHNGGGFSHYPAGMSNPASDHISVKEWSWAGSSAVSDSAWNLHDKREKRLGDQRLAALDGELAQAGDKLKAR